MWKNFKKCWINRKKSKNIKKNRKKKSGKIRKNNWKIINSTCIYDILPIFDERWKKKKKEEEDRKVLYKLLLTRAKNIITLRKKSPAVSLMGSNRPRMRFSSLRLSTRNLSSWSKTWSVSIEVKSSREDCRESPEPGPGG